MSLSNSDPALLSLPSIVTVPAGLDGAEFQATARAVPVDRDVAVTAAISVGRPATGTLSVWPLMPTFFSFVSQPGDPVGRGNVRRLTPPFAYLRARCALNEVQVSLSSGGRWWDAYFMAPNNGPLRVGTYEVSSDRLSSDPGFGIQGEGYVCRNASGASSFGKLTSRRPARYDSSGRPSNSIATAGRQRSMGMSDSRTCLRPGLRPTATGKPRGPAIASSPCPLQRPSAWRSDGTGRPDQPETGRSRKAGPRVAERNGCRGLSVGPRCCSRWD